MTWARMLLLAGWAVALPVAAEDGRVLYARYCAACHLPDGAGIAEVNPPVTGSLWRDGDRADVRRYLADVILNGMSGMRLDEQRYSGFMPAWEVLSDDEIAAIGTFMLDELNDNPAPLTREAVAEIRREGRDMRWFRAWRREQVNTP